MANLENPAFPTYPTWPILHFLHSRVCRIYITYNGESAMSTKESFYGLRDTLYKVGLLETLCFTRTMSGEWWFIKNDELIYSHWNSTGKCDVMIDFWGP